VIHKNIIFTPITESVGSFISPPFPSKAVNVPEWYKKSPKYIGNKKTPSYTIQGNNLTVKGCMPIVDSFTSGYTHCTPFDIEITREESSINVQWPSSIPSEIVPPIAVRPKEIENSNFPKIEGYDALTFGWTTYWNAKTPKGYSCLLTHPLNRPDLPFYSFSGIIDTDGWNLAGLHPFLLKEGWQGVIPAGTPMFQVIPFKRDRWNSKKEDFNLDDDRLAFKKMSVISGFYKTMFWNKKDYK
jgi:hypothetical protein